jgi:hypothetical protein
MCRAAIEDAYCVRSRVAIDSFMTNHLPRRKNSTVGRDTDQPETDVIEAVIWRTRHPNATARTLRIEVPRAAAHSSRIVTTFANIRRTLVFVQAPFPNIARKVENSLRRCSSWIHANRNGPLQSAFSGISVGFYPLGSSRVIVMARIAV